MNVLYIHRTQGRGVEGVHIGGIVNALRRMGNEVDIVSPVSGKKESGTGNNKFKIIAKAMPEILFELLEILYNLIACRKIKIRQKQKTYDFIYERYAFMAWAGMKYAKKLKVPLMLEVNFSTQTPIIRKRSKILSWMARYIEKKVFMAADAIFVVSSFLGKQLAEIGVPEEKIHLTPNAVDEKVFNAVFNTEQIDEQFKLTEKTVIGYVGGFYYWHGLDLLLRAVGKVEQQRKNIALLLVGEGPEKENIRKLAGELELTSNLVFPGMVDYKALPDYVSAMDVCVLPDFNNYGSPVKIFEYMAMGKPVVAPRLGPLEDVITDGKDGVLFEKGNINELSECFEKLMNDNDFYSRISTNARNIIFEKHLWKHNVEKILSEYQKAKGNG